MRKVLFLIAAGSMAVAAPAMAADAGTDTGARVDVHTGLGWADGKAAQSTLGATLGYDLATAGHTFVGVEQSADKVLTSQGKVRWTSAARFGAHVSDKDKAYVLAGYSYGVGPDGAQLGAGVEHNFGGYYGKLEYRHNFSEDSAKDSNAAVVGVGMHF